MATNKIRIAFKNFYPDFSIKDLGPAFNDNSYLLHEGYELVVVDEKPDVVFYGVFDDFLYSVSNDDSTVVKILFITEPVSADFVFFDYCVGFEPYDYGGRNIYYPFFLYNSISDKVFPTRPSFSSAKKILKEKNIFCEMVFSHDGRDISRKKYFDLLSTYKRVESAGTYLNNQKDGNLVDYRDGSKTKFDFQKKSKFNLCIQSIKKEWFINEKIMHALFANEIPIFYGCDEIKKIFNPKRFIFVEDYPNDKALLDRIIEIDKNDELFCSIISQPVFNEDNFPAAVVDEACRKISEILINKKKRITEKNREKYIKNILIKNKKAYLEMQKKYSNKIVIAFTKMKGFFRKRKK